MTHPLMDSDPTRTPDRTAHEVTPTDTVATTRRALAATGTTALVVVHAGEPVGVVTARALLAAPPTASVAGVMDYEVVRIDPTAGERRTVRAYTAAAWRSLLQRRPYRPGAPTPATTPR